MREAHRKIFQK